MMVTTVAAKFYHKLLDFDYSILLSIFNNYLIFVSYDHYIRFTYCKCMYNVIQLFRTNNTVYAWNGQKNRVLKVERGICFEEIVHLIELGCLIEELEHPNQERYAGQKILVVDVGGYAYLVPYKDTVEGKFLKTIIPSRKATKEYLKQNYHE